MKKYFSGFNVDQAMSMMNHVVGLIGAILLAWGIGTDVTNLVTGCVLTVMSIGIGVWMNGDNLGDAVQSIVRKVLALLLAFAATRGWIREDMVAGILGTAGTIVPVLWSLINYSKAPSPNFPGTTVVDKAPA